MALYVGTSQLPGRTFHKKQYMTNVLAARQLIAFGNYLEKKYGWRFSTSEADRSRPDQLFMYDQFLHHGGALAAYCSIYPLPDGTYTSTHDPVHDGDAADLAEADGSPLTVAHHNIIVNEGAAWGIYWTGRTFSRPEWWHFNIYPAVASIKAPANTVILTPASTIAKPILSGEAEMKTISIKGGATFGVGIGHLVHYGSLSDAKLVDSVMDDGTIKTITKGQAAILFEKLSLPPRWVDAVLFRKENKSSVYDRTNRNQTALSRIESALKK